MDHIAVIGTGYVGLVSGTCFAHVGYRVICLDIDEKKIAALQQGKIPIYEPRLEDMLLSSQAAGRLLFSTDYAEAVLKARIIILSVDTPMASDGKCDVSRIDKAATCIADLIENDVTIVIKSTVPVGTSRRIQALMQDRVSRRGLSHTIEVVSNPEFLREGNAVEDFLHPERVVLGVLSETGEEIMRDLYRPFEHRPEQFVVMDTASSELTKYAANCMLACRISFMNWFSRLCTKTGADIESVRQGIGSDSRIGPAFLHAGMGYGGSCFPKDVSALLGMAKEYQIPATLIEAIDETNRQQKQSLGEKIISYFEQRGGISGRSIAVLGLAFKPNTDDMREAPSLVLIEQLLKANASLRLFDPVALENAKKLLPFSPAISWHTDLYEAVTNCDAIAIVTEWDCCKKMSLARVRKLANACVFFDGRNLFDPEEMARSGFEYLSQGRPSHPITQAIENQEDFCLPDELGAKGQR